MVARELLIDNREQVHMERHSLACSQRVLAIRENFHPTKKTREQIAQAGPGEKILVITLQQMPGDDLPSMKVWQHLHVGDGEERPTPDHARDFAEYHTRYVAPDVLRQALAAPADVVKR